MIRKLSYMFKVFIRELFGQTDYWHPNLGSRKISKSSLRKLYYLDFSEKGIYPFKLKNGIPSLLMNGKEVFFSITIFNYGIGLLENYSRGFKNESKIKLIIDWCLSNQNNDGSWKNYYDVPEHNMSSGWTSSMGQGLGISFIFRCYHNGFISKEIAFEAIDNAYKFILNPELRSYINEKDYIFQEFSGTNHSVLNGYIFTIYGLYDYYLMTGNEKEFRNSIKVLKKSLNKFFILGGLWSYYSFSKIISSSFYHKLHIEMMQSIFYITEDEFFLKTAKRFKSGMKFKFLFIILKSIQKIIQFRTVNTLPN